MDNLIKSTKLLWFNLISIYLVVIILTFSVTHGQELNQQQSTSNDFDSETTAFLDWFYVNELLPYFLITSNQPSTINPGRLNFSPSTPSTKWLSPLPGLIKQHSNHYHQHVNLPPNQLIANVMPKKYPTIKDENISFPTINSIESNPSINQPDKVIFPETLINNPGYQLSPPMSLKPSSSLPSIYFNHHHHQINYQVDQSTDYHRLQPPRSSSRRHFGAPVPGTMTNDNFDKEKTIDESRAESINPLIKVNVKIRENIKALKELEATFQKQPIPRRIVSKLLLRALLNPLRK